MELAGLIGIGALLGGLVLMGTHVRRAKRIHVAPDRVEPRSLVHLIEGEAELRDAIRRAAQFDRDAAEAFNARADRYEAVVPPGPITNIRGGRGPKAPGGADQASRSA